MNDHLSALRLFVRVARRGSFSAGGRELNVPQPTVSRIIAALEREMGAALFSRTTRAVTLTEAGADFLARIEPILSALDEAEYAVRGTGELRGILRVGISSTFAIREIAPRLPLFMENPALRVELLADDQSQSFVDEGIDVGLRFGVLRDSTAVARRIAVWPRVIVASPSYVERAGLPRSPADLAKHSVVLGPSRLGPAWTFNKDGRATSVRVNGRLTATVNEVATAAAVAGLGLASMASVGCRSEIENGSLVRILPDWDMGAVELHAVLPGGRSAKPSARAFVDFLVGESAHWPGFKTA
ncbi:MAG: LysR family transcriptional regulator [Bradyrhizobiaceae bacterium]|nr:MAG: LysR family transcriptional regulator [Bradyrhizobiaceae bacterium]